MAGFKNLQALRHFVDGRPAMTERKDDRLWGGRFAGEPDAQFDRFQDRKSTRLNSSHTVISYAVFCLKKKKKQKKKKKRKKTVDNDVENKDNNSNRYDS